MSTLEKCTSLSTVGFVPLTRGYVAIVDADDLPLVAGVNWYCAYSNGCKYAKNSRIGAMHRLFLAVENGRLTDHENGNGLDNRRQNLRAVSHQENMQNRRKHASGKSKYKGVYIDDTRKNRRYRAQIRSNGNKVCLGRFTKEIEAARAYDEAARVLHGEFAKINNA